MYTHTHTHTQFYFIKKKSSNLIENGFESSLFHTFEQQ
jgi:hypothetical protein